MVMLSTLMLPQQVTLIPQFVVYRQLGWIDTFLPLIVPNLFGGPFFTFLLRQFFLTIPPTSTMRRGSTAARAGGSTGASSCRSPGRR